MNKWSIWTPILTFDIEPLSNNPNESYTRNPDLIGEFEQHSGIESSGGRLFSPGTKLDGIPFIGKTFEWGHW